MLGRNDQKKTAIVATQTTAVQAHPIIIWNCVLGGSYWTPEYHAVKISVDSRNKSTAPAMQKINDAIVPTGVCMSRVVSCVLLKCDSVRVHRAAANIIVSKSRAARGFMRIVLLSTVVRQPYQ